MKNGSGRTFWLLTILAVAAFALRCIKAEEAFGGFHSFNEAWYTTLAMNYRATRSFLLPMSVYGSIDYNVSPLFSALLYYSGSLFGFTPFAMRIVPIAFSSATIYVLFALGKRFFGERAGLISAALYSFIPISMIVGRNVQTDAPYVLLMLIALHLYLKAGDPGARRLPLMAAAGLVFGAAFMTKQFAAILLPAVVVWELIRNRGFRWFGMGQILFGLAALILPAPFFLYHLYYNRDLMSGAQSSLSGSQYHPLSWDSVLYLYPEYLWGMSPPVFWLAAAGLLYFLFRRSPGGLFVILANIVFGWFFLHWHGHSYYLLFAAPFLCMAAAAVLSSIRNSIIVYSAAAALCVMTIILSISMLCIVKYGYVDFQNYANQVENQQLAPVTIPTQYVGGSYYPLLRHLLPDKYIIREEELAATGLKKANFGDSPVFILGFAPVDSNRMPPLNFMVTREGYALMFKGRFIAAEMPSEHFFAVRRLRVLKFEEPAGTGLVHLGQYPSLIVGVVPPHVDIPIVNGMIDFRNYGAAKTP